ncbi:MAG: GNAT family N-acetyltransferase [Alphaproteobacteria bacterium]|nr:GNAT family N-acetyltransferase [Alphaproteobacteria bacterium]
MSEILTERLRGRYATEADFTNLRRIHANRTAMAWLSVDGESLAEADTREALRNCITCTRRPINILWMLERRSDGAFIGYCGIKPWTSEAGVVENELLYALLLEFWGQGYVPEIARSMLDEAFTADHQASIVAFTLPANRRSWRVMEKLGFVREADIVHRGLAHVFYRLKRATASNQ